MKNCNGVGCNNLTSDKDYYCEEHLGIISKHRILAGSAEAKAYKECKSVQRFKKVLVTESSVCFKCRDTAEVVHHVQSISKAIDKSLLVLCHQCHATYH